MAKKTKQIESPFTVQLGPLSSKLAMFELFCQANGVNISKGGVVRALIENLTESVELLGIMRIRAAKEKEELLVKRRRSAKG